MISLFNAIVRRGHCPREPSLQRLMKGLGMEVTPNSDETPELEDDDLSISEGAESSVETEDEPLELPECN